jgi:lipopolysaccharide biosynthesis glycosyltransferase
MSCLQWQRTGGDQGLLNQYFGEKWNSDIKYHLPFTYNCAASQAYFFAPAFHKFKGDIKILHFLGQGIVCFLGSWRFCVLVV